MHRDTLVDEFTRQAASFNASPAMSSAETLQALVDAMPLADDQAWLDVACGTGIVTRAIAPRVRRVVGVDLTPAMLDLARDEAAKAGLTNVELVAGDVGALELPDASFDGAVTRYSLHHIPVPGRVIREMARVVRPGGWVVVSDHVNPTDADAAAWHEEIERLRDPSHWACLTLGRRRALGAAAGLELVDERLQPVGLDYEDWLLRGSGGAAARDLIEAAWAERPAGVDGFRREGGTLWTLTHITVWRRPAAR